MQLSIIMEKTFNESRLMGLSFLLEHHRELFEGIFADTRLVASLNLLFQIVLHAHSKLIQLVPLLSQTHSAEIIQQ